MNGREAVEALHRSTMHGEPVAHPDRLLAFRRLDPTNRPAPFKTYAGVDVDPLPRELRESSLPAVDVLSGHRAEPALLDLDRDLLATLLFLTAGVSRVARSAGGEPTWFRTAMSAGNLHPVEVYVLAEDVHHYDPLKHGLVCLRRNAWPGGTGRSGDGITLALTGIPFRTCWKYGERGWRHLWWDAGTMLANLLAAADAHGVPARVMTAFPDAAVAALLGIDGVDEVPLALVHLGEGGLELPPPGALEPVTLQASPIAPRVMRLPLVVEAQASTALPADAVADWQQAAQTVARPVPIQVAVPSDADTDPDDHIEDVILRRGSTRMFRPQQAAAPLLDWALAAGCRAVPLDSMSGGSLLGHLVNVHDVAGTEPGQYRYVAPSGLVDHVPSDEPRAASAHLCLGQPLGGDAAYTVFHVTDLEHVVDRLGGRGYRAVHLEAGIVAGRLALNSVSLSGGATGLTFYDGEVSRYFRTNDAPLLATAVGIAATVPAASGTPGAPAELRGYDQVMTRLAASLRRGRGRA